jgi:DNA-3-methyladenine glycosylase II
MAVAVEGDRAASTMSLRLAVRLEHGPTLVEVRQSDTGPAAVEAESWPDPSPPDLRATIERVVNADLELLPFYELVAEHQVLGPLTRRLRGLKPFRPASLFDMLVTAVVEQQISLGAARQIRARLVRRFGDQIKDLWAFPRPEMLAEAQPESLTGCGLSRRKAEYVSGVAREVVGGSLDLIELETAPSDEVRSRITSLRGFGRWSADYILVRGLGRVDEAPVDDLGIRSILGSMFGDGQRLSAEEAGSALAPFAPFRGLAAFYLLVAARLP